VLHFNCQQALLSTLLDFNRLAQLRGFIAALVDFLPGNVEVRAAGSGIQVEMAEPDIAPLLAGSILVRVPRGYFLSYFFCDLYLLAFAHNCLGFSMGDVLGYVLLIRVAIGNDVTGTSTRNVQTLNGFS